MFLLRMVFTVFLLGVSAFAFDANASIVELLPRINEIQILEIWTNPTTPVQGQEFNVFVRVKTTFEAPEELKFFLKAKVNNTDVDILSIQDGLWWFPGSSAWSQGQHQVSVGIYLENKVEADALRKQITVLQQEIKEIEGRLLVEEDEAEKIILNQSLSEKTVEVNALAAELANCQTLIKTEAYSFQIL